MKRRNVNRSCSSLPPIDSPDDLKAARHALGWSLRQMAGALGLRDPEGKGADRLREMERGARETSGTIKRLTAALLSGWRPDDWSETDGNA
jgi:transcriptional regulator with XRE-family HTH domain